MQGCNRTLTRLFEENDMIRLIVSIIMVLVVACCASVAQAQRLGFDIGDDIAVEADNPDAWLKTRWSWLHEWETHNSQYLLEPSLIIKDQPGEADPKTDPKPGQTKAAKTKVAARPEIASLESLHAMAVRSLEAASQRGRPRELRVQATLALGRIGTEAAVDRLMQLLNDQDDNVSETAWIALGLAHTTKAREKLLDPGTLSSRQTLGWIVAIAMMNKPPDKVMRTLGVLVKQDRDKDVARMALWAMRQHNPPGLLEAARVIADQTIDPIAASEALLILGENRQTTDLATLKGVLLTRGRGVIKATDAIVRSVNSDSTAVLNNYNGGLLSAVRASSAIALGNYLIPPEDKYSVRARETLRKLFEEPPVPLLPVKGFRFISDYTHSGAVPFEIRMAAASLGRIGYAEDADFLVKVLRTRSLSDYRGRLIDAKFFMRRGYAAIALGTYLKRMGDIGIMMEATDIPDPTTRSSTGDRALWANHGPLEGEDTDNTRYALRKTLRALIDIASDRDEPYDLRAACVLALGMSNSPPRAIDIRNILKSPGGQDPVVATYGILALALLGDKDTLDLSAKALKNKPVTMLTADQLIKMSFAQHLSAGQIVINRALLQATGKIESTESVDLTRGQFGQDPWTSRQAVLTLRLLGDLSLVAPLSEVVDRYPELQRVHSKRGIQVPAKPDAGQITALAAWSLGQLLRPELEDRLAMVFANSSNYTLPLAPLMTDADQVRNVDTIYRLRSLANPSFYEFLAPSLPPRVDIRFRF